MLAKRKTYDTLVILLFQMRKEYLLPHDFIMQIPYSTRNQWRNYHKEIHGSQFRENFQDELRRTALYKKYRHLKKVLHTVEEIYIALASFFGLVRIKLHTMKTYRETVCDLIARFSDTIAPDKLRNLFHISSSTHQRWLFEIRSRCYQSFTGLCSKLHPNQLSRPEANCIRRYLTDTDFAHWPVNSIALYCLRENILAASIGTWYRYRKLFGITRKRYPRPEKKKGLKALRINQYWHADVSKIITFDGMLHHVYLLSDNFSRMILGRRRETFLSMNVNKEMICTAYEKAKMLIPGLQVELITDGGPENDNHLLNDFIKSTCGQVDQHIALRDIRFSNSAAEAMFRTLKGWYLPPEALKNGDTLDKYLERFEQDFCFSRPNAQLKGLTPAEVYFNTLPELHRADKIREAVAQRKLFNRKNGCGNC